MGTTYLRGVTQDLARPFGLLYPAGFPGWPQKHKLEQYSNLWKTCHPRTVNDMVLLCTAVLISNPDPHVYSIQQLLPLTLTLVLHSSFLWQTRHSHGCQLWCYKHGIRMTDTLLCKFLVFRKSNDMTCPQNDAFVPSKVSQGENHTRFSGISPFKQIISKHKLAFKGCAYQGIQYH